MREMISVALALGVLSPVAARAQIKPKTTCDLAGVGAVALTADVGGVKVLDAAPASAGAGEATVPYCLVKVLVPQAINIWVGLPMAGKWNGRLQSIGGGGYAGSVNEPTAAVAAGYAGVTTDTGHRGNDGAFGMLAPGQPNTQLQIDFAYRSEHLMSVIGRQLVAAFYGQAPTRSYWFGCSTGGRQGLMMAQRYPEDYDGIVAGAPAIHWDRFQAALIWPQVVMFRETGGPIAKARLDRATRAAVAACDAQDGVADGVIDDPRTCRFDARALQCGANAGDAECLSEKEAIAIDRIWEGPVLGGRRLWVGQTRGTDLGALGGPNPFPIGVAQPRYWVYFDPGWNWQTLDYDNYPSFFDQTVARVGPIMATDNPDLSRFRDRGGKLILWHGFADQLIMPGGTIEYYERVTKQVGGDVSSFARLFMAPGVAHCRGGDGPAPTNLLESVVDWVEKGTAPATITASRPLPAGGTRTRPLCPYPEVAVYKGSGSTDDAANFVCRAR